MNKDQLIEALRQANISERVITAIIEVKRENFIPDRIVAYAYENIPLPLEDGSTIAQPQTVAFMIDLLEPQENQKILEIGSGSGYAISLISNVIKSGKIYGIELIQKLAIKSKNLLANDSNITILNRDGSQGLPEFAPYDRILISASCPDRYLPYKLVDQLSENGIIVAAVKDFILYLRKTSQGLIEKEFPGYVFVPLVFNKS